ncbi:dihydrodipicolinate reductase, partial [Mycobacterium intracellulare subsp. intracellulare]|nr:dihydrodipicolinate reductase [Mycobacterium intracellulare subsp. intracellulare]
MILWGPGQVGIGALRALIAHPGLELAGVVVHAEAKDGKDAGDLCGMPATGVIA